MNQVYLEKLIEQEALNAKIELIREHIAIAKKEAEFYSNLKSKSGILNESIKSKLVNEFYTGERSELKFSTSSEVLNYLDSKNIPTWRDKGENTAAQYFENMGANIFEAGTNPYGYELDCNIWTFSGGSVKDSGKKDRIWFYPSGRVWSTNATISLGWKYENATAGLNKVKEADPSAYEKILKSYKDQNISGDVIKIYNQSSQTTIKLVDEQVWGVLVPSDTEIQREHAGLFTEKNQSVNGTKLVSFASIYNASKEEEAKKEEKHAIGWLDTLQTILDWAGFIPVVGDAIDVLNAIIYFIRYAASGISTYMWQGLLSLVAVIPVIGSAISGSLKAVFKFFKGKGRIIEIFKWIFTGVKNSKSLQKIYDVLKASGKMSSKQIKGLANIFVVAGDKLKKVLNAVKKLIPSGFYKSANKMGDNLKKAGEAFKPWAKKAYKVIDKGTDKVGKAIGDFIPNLTKAGADAYEKSKAWYNKATLQILPKLKAASWWPQKKLATVAATLTNNFKNTKLFKNKAGDVITGFSSKFGKGGGETVVKERMTNTLAKKFRPGAKIDDNLMKLVDGPNEKVYRWLTSVDDVTKAAVPKPSAKEITNFMKDVEKVDPKLYSDLSDDVLKTIKDGHGNAKFYEYKNSNLNQIGAAMWNKESLNANGAQLGSALSTMSKRYDIIYNEFQDVGEDLGLAHESQTLDQKQGVIYPITKYAVSEYMPGVASVGKQVGGLVVPAAKQAVKQGALTLANLANVDTGQFIDYDPSAEAGGQYA